MTITAEEMPFLGVEATEPRSEYLDTIEEIPTFVETPRTVVDYWYNDGGPKTSTTLTPRALTGTVTIEGSKIRPLKGSGIWQFISSRVDYSAFMRCLCVIYVGYQYGDEKLYDIHIQKRTPESKIETGTFEYIGTIPRSSSITATT